MAVGVNVHRYDGAVADALLAIQPPVIVTSNPDWDILRRVKAACGATIIYRHILPGNPDGHGVDPIAFARVALTAIAPYRDLVAGVQGYNEAISGGNVIEQAERELTFVRMVQAAGVPVVALNAAVGNLEPEHLPLLLDLWREAAAIGYHGYCRPYGFDLDGPAWPWHVRRPEALWRPVLERHGLGLGKMLLTETGTFYAPFPAMSPQDYAVLLCQIDDYAHGAGMLGTAAFTLSGYEPWQTVQPWELVGTEAVQVLAEYNRQHRSAPPQLRIPARNIPQPVQVQQEGDDMAEFRFGFKDIADKLGPAVVGEPVMDEKYVGDKFSLQITTKGVMLHYNDEGNHHSRFLPARS